MLEKLKSEMEKRGIKGYTLAKLSDIAPSDLYGALNGKKPMFPNWKKRIAEALKVDESELFNDSANSGEGAKEESHEE